MSPLRWTCKSTRTLADELKRQGFQVSPRKVGELLKMKGYRLQANRKTREGKQHPDRNAQFEHINRRVKACQRRGHPTVSVDTKKKEVLGNHKNAGRTYCPKGKPREVDTHDFPDKKLGKAIPYGVYDLENNEAWVSVGIDHDTAEFAVASIAEWWRRMGRKRYGRAKRVLITGDSGGSNGHRNRLWKAELQRFANRTGMIVEVCHFPPGTSKWNKIEHRLFCHITRNWQGIPLETHEVVVNLIGSTRTLQGLEVHAWLDERGYPKGRKVTDAELAELYIRHNTFHGDWNYEIHPQTANQRIGNPVVNCPASAYYDATGRNQHERDRHLSRLRCCVPGPSRAAQCDAEVAPNSGCVGGDTGIHRGRATEPRACVGVEEGLR